MGMDLADPCSIRRNNFSSSFCDNEEWIEMHHATQCRQKWRMRRTFEVNRLSQSHVVAAYEKVVPTHVRVLSRERWDRMFRDHQIAEPSKRERRAA